MNFGHSKKLTPRISLIFIITLCFMSCYRWKEEPQQQIHTECLNPTSTPPAADLPDIQTLNVLSTARWPDPVIPVCWEPESFRDYQEAERQLVQRAVTNSWQAALKHPYLPLEQQYHFEGWGECTAESKGVRIQVIDSSDTEHTKDLGYKLNGMKNGVVLNFAFNHSPDVTCKLSPSYCIYIVAVHEFGHVLGFSHEQNRTDTPRDICHAEMQGHHGDLYIGPWDLNSIMNYCNPKWDGYGILSLGDQLAAQQFYYPTYFRKECWEEYKNQQSPSEIYQL